jgi:hypothetical protein
MNYFDLRHDDSLNVAYDTLPFDFQKRDIHASMLGYLPDLIDMARDAAKAQASSRRGFKVGAAAVAYDQVDDPRIGIFVAGNLKYPHDEEHEDSEENVEGYEEIPKLCGEANIINAADYKEFKRIGIFVITATTDPKKIFSVNRVKSKTLHPCWEGHGCDKAMFNNSMINDHTILFSTGNAVNISQVQKFSDYHQRYDRFKRGHKFEDAPAHKLVLEGLGGCVVKEYADIIAKKTKNKDPKRTDIIKQRAAFTAIKRVSDYTPLLAA